MTHTRTLSYEVIKAHYRLVFQSYGPNDLRYLASRVGNVFSALNSTASARMYDKNTRKALVDEALWLGLLNNLLLDIADDLEREDANET